jgi:DNA-binding CsgD family transcriptional regulator
MASGVRRVLDPARGAAQAEGVARPGEAGLRRVLAVADLLIGAADEEPLLPALLPLLLRALPGDSLVWSWRTAGSVRPRAFPEDLLTDELLRAFARSGRTDPLVARTALPCGPVRRSDLQSAAERHRTALHAEVLRPLGIEYQLAMSFPAGYAAGAPRSVCLAVNRGGRDVIDFTDEDVAVAALLRGRLTRALSRLAPPAPPPSGLTPREAAVLDLLARGLADQQIARRLCISPRTVDKHLEHAYAKLRVHGRVEAATAWLAYAG